MESNLAKSQLAVIFTMCIANHWLALSCVRFAIWDSGYQNRIFDKLLVLFPFYCITLFYIFNLLKLHFIFLHYKSNSSEGCRSLSEYQT